MMLPISSYSFDAGATLGEVPQRLTFKNHSSLNMSAELFAYPRLAGKLVLVYV